MSKCLLSPDETEICEACADWGAECGGTNRIVKEVQIERMKALYPGAITLFMVRDLYRAYKEDAATVAAVLGLALKLHKGKPIMAEFPRADIKDHLTKLIGAGHKVVIDFPEWSVAQ